MNDVDYIKHRMKSRKNQTLNDGHFKRFYNFMVKVMVAIVIMIAVVTYAKLEPDATIIQKYIMEDLHFGTLVASVSRYFSPFFDQEESVIPVSQSVDYQLIDKNYYKNTSNQVISLCEGTVIYTGYQDILKDYIIIQGINGLKITYGQVNEGMVQLYDYVHAGDTMGIYDTKMILIFEYDGKEISYEEAKQFL